MCVREREMFKETGMCLIHFFIFYFSELPYETMTYELFMTDRGTDGRQMSMEQTEKLTGRTDVYGTDRETDREDRCMWNREIILYVVTIENLDSL